MAGLHLIVGLGLSGFSCVRFLVKHGISVAVMDTRAQPPLLNQLQREYPNVPCTLGKMDTNLLEQAQVIVLSPSIALATPEIAAQVDQGKEIIGDIELFARVVNKPVIAITGTNAKSTVTTLVGLMAQQAGLKAQVGGNLGIPALDLLKSDAEVDVYVLELSSFQLETTFSLRPKVAAILNISPDHMDRYASFEDYIQAKQRIYQHAEHIVYNDDDSLTYPANTNVPHHTFTLKTPQWQQFGLLTQDQATFLAYEHLPLLAIKHLPILGQHYQANALAALSIAEAFGLDRAASLEVLKSFTGLAHRCQLVRELERVRWYNDSKGTNVGATLAAILGLGSVIEGKLVLILGGVGKNADFSQLKSAVADYARSVILLGEAADVIQAALANTVEIQRVASMAEAVAKAKLKAKPSDCVLLSPACASLDMFKNFEHRGLVFTELVQALPGN